MREILVYLFMLGVVGGLSAYCYIQYKIYKHKNSLAIGSGGGGESRPAKKNP